MTFVLDSSQLAYTKKRAFAGDDSLQAAMANLKAGADDALKTPPVSVAQKKATPPSGDKHDYMSVGPYWWPDPDAPDGLPYVRRDGRTNPQRFSDSDFARLERMAGSCRTLALAWYFTGEKRYAEHAGKLLKVWFADEATRMKANLNFGQAIPGRCEGRAAGIIDTAVHFPKLIDAICLLPLPDAELNALKDWMSRYLDWLMQSNLGRGEAEAHNNHGTYYDVQLVAQALFTGRVDIARAACQAAGRKRIATQIEPDGSQPHELKRTKSLSYTVMNLTGLCDLADLARHTNVDLWNFQTPDGRGIRKAVDYVFPFAIKTEKWRHEQIVAFDALRYIPVFRRARDRYGESEYESAIELLDRQRVEKHVFQLLYPPPA